MKIYDISQEVFSCEVYPGDPTPSMKPLVSIETGSSYNLSEISMCVHNGTHVDAPAHFIEKGKTIDEIPLENFVGMAYVAHHDGIVTAKDALSILDKASKIKTGCEKRILIKGSAEVSVEAAEVFAEAKILLIGNESQSVGSAAAPEAVHKILLSKDIVLLEGIRLEKVPEGSYLLNALPLSLASLEGSPCRAVLIATVIED